MNQRTFALGGLALTGLLGFALTRTGGAAAPPSRAAIAPLIQSAASALLASAQVAGTQLAALDAEDPLPATRWSWERIDTFGVTVTYGRPARGAEGPVFVFVHPEQVPEAYAHCLDSYREIAQAELRLERDDGSRSVHPLRPVLGQGVWMLGLVLPTSTFGDVGRASLLGWEPGADPGDEEQALLDAFLARSEDPAR